MTANTMNHESPEKEKQMLSSKERAVLSQMATKEPPHSQRAQALLAINKGVTQAEAGVRTGLTKGQVRYWLTKFRRDGTGIFPDELLIQAQQVEADLPQSSAKQADSTDLSDAEETARPPASAPVEHEDRPKVKKKKSKKAKKSVKTKKSKKDKKALKGKKPEKKTKKEKPQKTKGIKGKSGKKKRKK